MFTFPLFRDESTRLRLPQEFLTAEEVAAETSTCGCGCDGCSCASEGGEAPEIGPDGTVRYGGTVFSFAWTFFDDNEHADLYVNNHFGNSFLYLDLGTPDQRVELLPITGDKHGAVWIDIDADGDVDLFQTRGASRGDANTQPERYENQLWENRDGDLVQVPGALGLNYPFSRARSLSFFDGDLDGDLDAFQGATLRPDGTFGPAYFENQDGSFSVSSLIPHLNSNIALSNVHIDDFNGDGLRDVMSIGFDVFIQYGLPEGGFSAPELVVGDDFDSALVADFDGDNRPDLFLTRGSVTDSVFQPSSDTLRIEVGLSGGRRGVSPVASFASSSPDITIKNSEFLSLESTPQLFVGAAGQLRAEGDWSFSALDPSTWGEPPASVTGTQNHIRLWYDVEAGLWRIKYEFRATSKRDFMSIVSDGVISQAVIESTEARVTPGSNTLLLNKAQGWIDASESSGISDYRASSVFSAAADFDNDGDMDIYVQGSTQAGSTGNYFFVNQGNGDFVGAAQFDSLKGSDYAVNYNPGIGAFASATDYDGDGFVDILTGNGARSENYLLQFGGYSLFRNEGGDGRWVKINLTGDRLNVPAIGALVELLVDGSHVVRMSNNGQRAYSTEFSGQESAVMHFGLGTATTIDRIVVRWTDGTASLFKDVASNQLINIQQAEAVIATDGRENFFGGDDAFRYVFSTETTSVRGLTDNIYQFGPDDTITFSFFNGKNIVTTTRDFGIDPEALLVRVFDAGTANEYVQVNFGGLKAGDFQLRIFGSSETILDAIARRTVTVGAAAQELFDASDDRFIFAYLTPEQSSRDKADTIRDLGLDDKIDLAFFDGLTVVGSLAEFAANPDALLLRVMGAGTPDAHVQLNYGGLEEDGFVLKVFAAESVVRAALDLDDAPPAPFRVEAEALQLVQGFTIANNNAASGGRFIAAVGSGEQIARYGFAAASGIYDLTVGYFDENDGVAELALFVNNAEVDRWSWDANLGTTLANAQSRTTRSIEDVALRDGDTVELRGFGATGEPLRTDFIDFAFVDDIVAPPTPFRVEAETLQLAQGFTIASNNAASDGRFIASVGSGEQIARYGFAAANGVYDLAVGYFDETDGVSELGVFVNGAQIDRWLWDGTFGTSLVSAQARAVRNIEDVSLRDGDIIELRGFGAPGEPLRTDYIDFTFVG